jgi:hypothetical protein
MTFFPATPTPTPTLTHTDPNADPGAQVSTTRSVTHAPRPTTRSDRALSHAGDLVCCLGSVSRVVWDEQQVRRIRGDSVESTGE